MLHTLPANRLQPLSWSWYGVGHCCGHFGELLQGVFQAETGLTRGLVTLPCRKIGAVARVVVTPGDGSTHTPLGKTKIRKVIEAYRRLLDVPTDCDIKVEVESSIPIGLGMGSSTADIVSTIRALDQAFGIATSSADLIKLTLNAEAACDSTMLSHSVRMFAQRNGTIIEDFQKPLMPLVILGFNLMPGDKFDTDDTPPAEYDDQEIRAFERLRSDLRSALRERSVHRLAAVATESAMINEQHFPKNNFDKFQLIARMTEAAGICVAHSGTIAGLIFPAADFLCSTRINSANEAADEAGFEALGNFRI